MDLALEYNIADKEQSTIDDSIISKKKKKTMDILKSKTHTHKVVLHFE